MTRVTGTGCQLSGLTAAYLAANKDNPLEAAAAAVSAMGLAGEIAWQNMQSIDGNSTYRNRIIDAISNLSGDELEEGARYEIR
jgi:hydroxyethylthiazole kinase